MSNKIMQPAVSIQLPEGYDPLGADRQARRRHVWGESAGLRNHADSDIVREIREEQLREQRKDLK